MCLVCLRTNTVWLATLSWRSQWRFPSSDVMVRSVEQIFRRFGKRATSFCTLNMVTARRSETSLHLCFTALKTVPFTGPTVAQASVSRLSPTAGFVVNKVAPGQDFVRVSRLSPVSIIPPLLHTHQFIYHRRYIDSASDSVFKWYTWHQLTGTLNPANNHSREKISITQINT
jgi:hypothetical protein